MNLVQVGAIYFGTGEEEQALPYFREATPYTLNPNLLLPVYYSRA